MEKSISDISESQTTSVLVKSDGDATLNGKINISDTGVTLFQVNALMDYSANSRMIFEMDVNGDKNIDTQDAHCQPAFAA